MGEKSGQWPAVLFDYLRRRLVDAVFCLLLYDLRHVWWLSLSP